MRRSLAVALAALSFSFAGTALAQGHAKGLSCATRADCGDGLHCLANVCVDAATFEGSRSPERQDNGIDYHATYTYLGGVLGAMLPFWSGGTFGEGAQFAGRFGAVFDEMQLGLEISPMTTVIGGLGPNAFGMLEAVGTIAWVPHISNMVSWIARIGGGGGFLLAQPQVFDAPSQVVTIGFGEARLDVFGVLIRTSRHLTVEINTPSFRMLFASGLFGSGTTVMMSWVTSFAMNYVF